MGSPGMWPQSRLHEVRSEGEGGANQQRAGTQSDWPGATAPKGGACEVVAAELGAGGCAPGLAPYEGERWVSGRVRGGPGPARLYAVPWGWGVRLRGALWSRMLVGGAGRQVRRQMTAWGVKQGLERIGVPAASPGWGEGGFEVPGLGGTPLGTLFTPCPTPALPGSHSQNTWGPDAFSPSPWLPERAPFLEAGPRGIREATQDSVCPSPPPPPPRRVAEPAGGQGWSPPPVSPNRLQCGVCSGGRVPAPSTAAGAGEAQGDPGLRG